VIFDIIFLLMFTISKFTKTTLENTLSRRKALGYTSSKQNEKKHTILMNLAKDFSGFYKKFPYVFYFNALMLGMMLISITLWYLDKYHFNFL